MILATQFSKIFADFDGHHIFQGEAYKLEFCETIFANKLIASVLLKVTFSQPLNISLTTECTLPQKKS